MAGVPKGILARKQMADDERIHSGFPKKSNYGEKRPDNDRRYDKGYHNQENENSYIFVAASEK